MKTNRYNTQKQTLTDSMIQDINEARTREMLRQEQIMHDCMSSTKALSIAFLLSFLLIALVSMLVALA